MNQDVSARRIQTTTTTSLRSTLVGVERPPPNLPESRTVASVAQFGRSSKAPCRQAEGTDAEVSTVQISSIFTDPAAGRKQPDKVTKCQMVGCEAQKIRR